MEEELLKFKVKVHEFMGLQVKRVVQNSRLAKGSYGLSREYSKSI